MRRAAWFAPIVGLAAVLGIGGGYLASQTDSGAIPTYSVAQVAAGLSTQPRQWLGRTVRLRAVVQGFACLEGCAATELPSEETVRTGKFHPQLIDPQILRAASTDSVSIKPPISLLMGIEPRSSFLDALSRAPLIGSLVPGQRIAWHGPAIYQLRLQTLPCPRTYAPCYEGVLSDVIPTDPYARR